MRIIFKLLYLLFAVFFLVYLSIPNRLFPQESQYSKRSTEPADVEDENRRGFYNTEDRETVVNYYRDKFGKVNIFGYGINLPSLRLNYPPEESQTIIRDQTRSTYLEEIVHPLRQSIYISSFEPKYDKDRIVVDGTEYKQKLIIKMIDSNPIIRLFIGCLILLSIYVNLRMWREVLMGYKKIIYEK